MAVALGGPAAVAALGELPHNPITTFPGTFMLLTVIAAAVVGRLLTGSVAAVLSFVLLALVFIEPRGTINLSGETVGALITFAVAGVLVSHLLGARDAAQEAAEASERRYRELIERLPQVTYIARYDDRRLLYVSPQLESLIGSSPEEALAAEDFWDRSIHPGDRERVRSAWEAWRAGAMTEPFRCEYRLGRGERAVWVADGAVLVRGPGGKPLHFEGSLLDQSRQRELEEQLRQSQKLEAVGTLAGGIAHDFNNLLGVVGGYAHLLATKAGPAAEHRSWAREIAIAAERGATLVRQLLAVSRRQVLNPHAVDLNDVVDAMESMLRRLIGEDVELVVRNDPELHPVFADRAQVEHVLLNLVVNARDAMPNGGRLTIETAAIELDDPPREGLPRGPYSELSVADTGHGIDAETQQRIFEPFFTTKPEGKGTGLGLATVYGIVTQSGGAITVSSAPGEGARFRVVFPTTELVAEPAGPEEPTPSVRGAGERVLLVEDEPMLRELGRLLLTEAGYTVIPAEDGAAALAAVEEHDARIDLVVTDVVMPRMNGPELAERVRARIPGVPVVYVSGYHDRALAGRGIGPDDLVIEKPFREDELRARVGEALGRSDA